MTERREKQRALRVRALASAWVTALTMSGCGRVEEPGKPASSGESTPAPAVANAPAPPPGQSDRYNQTFEEATTTRAPDGFALPPANTLNGHLSTRILLAVRDEWPQIRFPDADGKPAPVPVAFDTEAGSVEITLFPEYAPNHVRNFLALARVSYYNGLVFDRVIRQEFVSDGGGKTRLDVVTGGCPVGTGEAGAGHLGYFLRPETSGLAHDEGTVGFVRTDDPSSACCRLYICLSSAPILDGQFTSIGKVTQGLEVIKTIAARPVKDPANYPESEQPKTPVRIHKIERK